MNKNDTDAPPPENITFYNQSNSKYRTNDSPATVAPKKLKRYYNDSKADPRQHNTKFELRKPSLVDSEINIGKLNRHLTSNLTSLDNGFEMAH
jgi:hypothetical protein